MFSSGVSLKYMYNISNFSLLKCIKAWTILKAPFLYIRYWTQPCQAFLNTLWQLHQVLLDDMLCIVLATSESIIHIHIHRLLNNTIKWSPDLHPTIIYTNTKPSREKRQCQSPWCDIRAYNELIKLRKLPKTIMKFKTTQKNLKVSK